MQLLLELQPVSHEPEEALVVPGQEEQDQHGESPGGWGVGVITEPLG